MQMCVLQIHMLRKAHMLHRLSSMKARKICASSCCFFFFFFPQFACGKFHTIELNIQFIPMTQKLDTHLYHSSDDRVLGSINMRCIIEHSHW